MVTAIQHPMPDRVKPSIVLSDIRALWRSGLMSKITNDGLTRSDTTVLYSCTHMTTVGVKGSRRHCTTVACSFHTVKLLSVCGHF